MKKKLQKQMDSMMEMTMDAITNNTKLVPALNELFKGLTDTLVTC